MSMLDANSINMSGYAISELSVGQKASFSKTILTSDIYNFAGIIGDFNPVHMNAEYAKTTRFGGQIAHGMLTASFISTVLGMALPGADAIFLEQNLKFTARVHVGDTITATAEIIDMDVKHKILTMKTVVTIQDGTVVVDGQAKIMATKKL